MKQKYYSRIADNQLEFLLTAAGAVLIKGPKACGKTTTAMMKSKSIIAFQNKDFKSLYDNIMSNKPSIALEGDNPRLIDEWQMYPVVWDCIRTEIDRRNEEGLFILTGSAVPPKDSENPSMQRHTGTTRIATMIMYPMSLYESKESNGKISLIEMFNNKDLCIDGVKSDLTYQDLLFAICRGGWPSSLSKSTKKAQLYVAKMYFDSLCEEDIYRVERVEKDTQRSRSFLKSYARNVCTLVKNSTLLSDINLNGVEMSENTLYKYLRGFNKLFIIDEIDSWSPAIRSATSIRTSKKRCFVDPSIGVAALGLTPEALYFDPNTTGFFFENLCIRDLRVYSSEFGGTLSHYHDRLDLEVDTVIHLEDGRYALVEIKLGSGDVKKGEEKLLEAKSIIRKYNENNPTKKMREPEILLILTGEPIAYKTNSGVYVVPIGCLKP